MVYIKPKHAAMYKDKTFQHEDSSPGAGPSQSPAPDPSTTIQPLPPPAEPTLLLLTKKHGTIDISKVSDTVDVDLDGKAGEGAFGQVFKGRLKRKGRLVVAVKIIALKAWKDEENAAALTWNEMVLHLKCYGKGPERHNPFILPYVGGFLGPDYGCLITPFMEEGTLYDLLKKHPAGIPMHLFCVFMVQLASAVQHIHRCQVLHRDLKPSNILQSRDRYGQPLLKVADFGVAARMTDEKEIRRGGCGTQPYIAPENMRAKPAKETYGPKEAAKGDVYALGQIGGNLLTGEGHPPKTWSPDKGAVRARFKNAANERLFWKLLNPDYFLRCSVDEFLEDAWPAQIQPPTTWKDDAYLLPEVDPKGKGRNQQAEGKKRKPLQNLSNVEAPPAKKAKQDSELQQNPTAPKAKGGNENAEV